MKYKHYLLKIAFLFLPIFFTPALQAQEPSSYMEPEEVMDFVENYKFNLRDFPELMNCYQFITQLLVELESETFEEKYTEEQQRKIFEFIINFGRAGIALCSDPQFVAEFEIMAQNLLSDDEDDDDEEYEEEANQNDIRIDEYRKEN